MRNIFFVILCCFPVLFANSVPIPLNINDEPIVVFDRNTSSVSYDNNYSITHDFFSYKLHIYLNNADTNLKKELVSQKAENITFSFINTSKDIVLIGYGSCELFGSRYLAAYSLGGDTLWEKEAYNDFFIESYYYNDRLVTGFINSGVLLIIDDSGKPLIQKQIFQRMYSVYVLKDNRILAFGLDDYKKADYKLKLLDQTCNISSEIPGLYCADKIAFCQETNRVIVYSGSTYYNNDINLKVYDIDSGELVFHVTPSNRAKFAIFSDDGQYIISVSELKIGCEVEIFTSTGSFVTKHSISKDNKKLELFKLDIRDGKILIHSY